MTFIGNLFDNLGNPLKYFPSLIMPGRFILPYQFGHGSEFGYGS
jgi:hypothetical protein